MSEDDIRNLLAKHDTTLDHLMVTQTETNKRLEEITKFLTKQVVFSNKLENMDRDVAETFKRVHDDITNLYKIQNSTDGCNSVRLLTKDIEAITKDLASIVKITSEQQTAIKNVAANQSNYPTPATIRWGVGILILGAVSFSGVFIQNMNTNTVLAEIVKSNSHDTGLLMEKVFIHNKDK